MGQAAHGQVDPIEKDIQGRRHKEGHQRAGEGRRRDLALQQGVRGRRVLQVQEVVARGKLVADEQVQPPLVPEEAQGAGGLVHGKGQGAVARPVLAGLEVQARAGVVFQERLHHGELPPLRRLVHGPFQRPGDDPLLPKGGVRGPLHRDGQGGGGDAEHAPVEDQGAEKGG